MGLYQNRILPRLIDLAMRNRELVCYRQRVLSAAQGRVLEIGIGSGMNFPFYGSRVTEMVGLEPGSRLLEMAREGAKHSAVPVTLLNASAEAIPFPDDHFDTVVTTWTLCSIPAVSVALKEMHRVLKPSGRLLFVEHGRAPQERIQRWQHRLTPAWKHIAGGCHLDRPIRELVESAGFSLEHLQTGYMKGPKAMTYMYEGRAVAK